MMMIMNWKMVTPRVVTLMCLGFAPIISAVEVFNTHSHQKHSKLPFSDHTYVPPKFMPFKPDKEILKKMKVKLAIANSVNEINKINEAKNNNKNMRRVQQSDSCVLCDSAAGSILQQELIPTDLDTDPPQELNCLEWNSVAVTFDSQSSECDELIQSLRPQCCVTDATNSTTTNTNTTQQNDTDTDTDFDTNQNPSSPTQTSITEPQSTPSPTNAPVAPTSQQDEGCTICGGNELRREQLPNYQPMEDVPENLSCGEWNDFYAALATGEECRAIKSFFGQCCKNSVPGYQCERNIRTKILDSMDTAAAPIVSYQDGLDITVDLVFWHITELNEQTSTAEIFVWLNLIWNDPRLAWTPDPDHCNDAVALRASLDVEKSEIWVPDFDLFNQVGGLQELGDYKADVYSDGTVSWRRNGAVKALCDFVGLGKIPFDTVGCRFIFGAWERLVSSNDPYHYILGNNGTGLTFGDFNPAYNEYQLVREKSIARTDGIQVVYDFYFNRARNFYIWNIIVPTIILTVLSFGVFLVDIQVAERISFCLALALVIVAQQLITSHLLPVSNERLWIDKFVSWSFYFIVFGLIESLILGYLHHVEQNRMKAMKHNEKKNDDFVGVDGIYNDSLNDTQIPPRVVHHVQPTQNNTTLPVVVDDEESLRSKRSEELRKRYTQSVWKAVSSPGKTRDEGLNDVASLQQMLETMDVGSLPEPPADMNDIPVDNTRPKRTVARRKKPTNNPQQRAPVKRSAPNRVTQQNERQSLHVKPHFLFFGRFTLRSIDHFCFFLSVGTYTIFLIVMFVTVPLWDSDPGYQHTNMGG